MINQSKNALNPGDFVKHASLAWVVYHVVELGHIVSYFETHAGAGAYEVVPDASRAYLAAGLPASDGSPTEPYFSALRSEMMWASKRLRCPGSPLIAAHQLRHDLRHSATLFDIDPAACASLAALLPKARVVEGSALDESPANPFVAGDNRCPIVLVDPFGVCPTDDNASLAQGLVSRTALDRLVRRVCSAAGKHGPALLLVWSHGDSWLQPELRALGSDLREDARFVTVGIERGNIRTPYFVVVMGIGDVGRRVLTDNATCQGRRRGLG